MSKNNINKDTEQNSIDSIDSIDSLINLTSNLQIKVLEKPKLKTEDTGKIFEKAICLANNINYDGNFKYNLEDARKLVPHLLFLNSKFPNLKHIASHGSRYDFSSELLDSNNEISLSYLSAKTTKKHCKVAPQVIGQLSPKLFCERINIPIITKTELKKHIQLYIKNILPYFEKYTFDCPIIYYNENKKTIKYIKKTSDIIWSNLNFVWTKDCKNWISSSTLKIVSSDNIKQISILEIQFHNSKNRKNM